MFMMSAFMGRIVPASSDGHGADRLLYRAPDDVPEAYRGIGVRIEDDIVNGYRNR